jgi:hypothetical protein
MVFMLNELKRFTIFVMHGDDEADYEAALAWFERFRDQVNVVEYSTGGWEHLWHIEATPEAIAEVPEAWLCDSEWSKPELFKK